MKRNYIGLACTFHDPALAIVNVRGELVFAEATERPFQTKAPLIVCPIAILTASQRSTSTATREPILFSPRPGVRRPSAAVGSPRWCAACSPCSFPMLARASKWGIYRYFFKSQTTSLNLASESLRFHDAFDRHRAAACAGPQRGGPSTRTPANDHRVQPSSDARGGRLLHQSLPRGGLRGCGRLRRGHDHGILSLPRWPNRPAPPATAQRRQPGFLLHLALHRLRVRPRQGRGMEGHGAGPLWAAQ